MKSLLRLVFMKATKRCRFDKLCCDVTVGSESIQRDEQEIEWKHVKIVRIPCLSISCMRGIRKCFVIDVLVGKDLSCDVPLNNRFFFFTRFLVVF